VTLALMLEVNDELSHGYVEAIPLSDPGIATLEQFLQRLYLE
jgi:hypothetical protein